jgi:hypothetical protein
MSAPGHAEGCELNTGCAPYFSCTCGAWDRMRAVDPALLTHAELVRLIINGTPRMHATGFVQLYLTPTVRLHVWSDDTFAAAPDVSQIAFFHDHGYTIKSHALRGALLDTRVEVLNDHQGLNDWAVWEVRPAHEGEPEKPHLATMEPSKWLALLPPSLIRAGESYEIPKRVFHQTRNIGTTVSVMRKVDEENSWARLMVPTGFDPVHSLVRQPDKSAMQHWMLNAVAGFGSEERDIIARTMANG